MRNLCQRMSLWISVFSMIIIGSVSVCLAEGRFHLSGYGNAHMMDHNGLPKLLDRDDPSIAKHDPNDTFLQIREFSLFFDFSVTDGVLASVEIEAGKDASAFTPNYAYVEFDIPTIADVWDEDRFGGLTLRVGKIIVPFLSYNENKPNFKQNLMSQPFTAWNLVPVIPSPPDFVGLGWSDTGGVLNWNHELGESGLVDLKLSVINGIQSDAAVLDANAIRLDHVAMPPMSPAVVRPRDGLIQNGHGANDHGDVRDNNQNKATVAKITVISADFPVDIGFSWYQGAWDRAGKQDLTMQGVHLNWLERNWTLKGEWVRADVEQTAGIDIIGMAMTSGINKSTGDYTMDAWYAEASYIPLRYGNAEDRFIRMVLRYDAVDTNDQAMFTPFDRSRITAGSEWQFVSKARLRYEWQRHTLNDFDKAPGPFKAAGGEEHVTMHMVSIIFWF
ncbi:MAG: hypothetical protein ACE5GK_02320 [Nitrospiria bacterium]